MRSSRPSRLRLYSLIALMTLLWAGNFVVAKLALREIPPLLTVGLRMIIAALCMIPAYRSATRDWDKRDLIRVLSLGILGVGLNQVLFVLGLARTSVAHAAIIIGLTPVTVLVLAALMGQEHMRASRIAGMLIALAGVVLLQFASEGSNAHTLMGDLLVFLGSSTFAFYTVAGKTMAHRLGSITLNTIAYGASALLLLPVTVWLGSGFRFENVTWVGWASLLYMAVFASATCYIIYYYALSHVAASRVAAFSYVQPVIATLMAIPMLGEHPTRSLVVGGVLVFAGVLVAERT